MTGPDHNEGKVTPGLLAAFRQKVDAAIERVPPEVEYGFAMVFLIVSICIATNSRTEFELVNTLVDRFDTAFKSIDALGKSVGVENSSSGLEFFLIVGMLTTIHASSRLVKERFYLGLAIYRVYFLGIKLNDEPQKNDNGN